MCCTGLYINLTEQNLLWGGGGIPSVGYPQLSRCEGAGFRWPAASSRNNTGCERTYRIITGSEAYIGFTQEISGSVN